MTAKGESLCQNLGVEVADHQRCKQQLSEVTKIAKQAVELLGAVMYDVDVNLTVEHFDKIMPLLSSPAVKRLLEVK